jgi:hypothetical protein
VSTAPSAAFLADDNSPPPAQLVGALAFPLAPVLVGDGPAYLHTSLLGSRRSRPAVQSLAIDPLLFALHVTLLASYNGLHAWRKR